MISDDNEDDMLEDGLLDLSDDEVDAEEAADDSDPYDHLYAEEETEFPEDEEDEDNPDWYRLPERGDHDSVEAEAAADAAGDDDATVGSGEGELFRHYIDDSDEQDDGAVLPLRSENLAAPRIAPRGLDVHYDAEGFYGYVMIRRIAGDVTPSDVKAVSDALTKANVMVVRDGPSQRAAANGVQYGWYLRVQHQGGAKPAADVVEVALRPFALPPKPRTSAVDAGAVASARIAILEARLEYQNREAASLRSSNEALTRELAQVRATEQATRRRQAEADDEWSDRIQRVLSALGQIRNDADGERKRAALLAAERDRVAEEASARSATAAREQDELARLADDEIVLRSQAIERLEDKLRTVESERDQLASERDRLAGELAAQSDAVRASSDEGARRAGGVDFKKALDALLPSVTLMPGSLDVMLKELADPSPVLRLLHEVVSKGSCDGQKQLRTVRGWFDVHYSTGQKDDGRLYFSRRNDRWIALVSRKTSKGEQDRDIERLRRVKL